MLNLILCLFLLFFTKSRFLQVLNHSVQALLKQNIASFFCRQNVKAKGEIMRKCSVNLNKERIVTINLDLDLHAITIFIICLHVVNVVENAVAM